MTLILSLPSGCWKISVNERETESTFVFWSVCVHAEKAGENLLEAIVLRVFCSKYSWKQKKQKTTSNLPCAHPACTVGCGCKTSKGVRTRCPTRIRGPCCWRTRRRYGDAWSGARLAPELRSSSDPPARTPGAPGNPTGPTTALPHCNVPSRWPVMHFV